MVSSQIVTYPKRRLIRSVFQFVVSVGPILPLVYEQATQHNPEAATGFMGGALAINAAIVRVMGLPQVEGFLQNHVPWLSATPVDKPLTGV